MITWLVNVLVNVYYTFGMPDRDLERGGITVWMQNTAHPTPFTLDTLLTSVYWCVCYFVAELTLSSGCMFFEGKPLQMYQIGTHNYRVDYVLC